MCCPLKGVSWGQKMAGENGVTIITENSKNPCRITSLITNTGDHCYLIDFKTRINEKSEGYTPHTFMCDFFIGLEIHFYMKF